MTKKKPTKPTIEKELRMMEVRLADDAEPDKMVVEGYAVRFDEPTVLWEYEGIEYKEVIERGALDGADMSDVPFKYNHSNEVMIMARTRNKTLELRTENDGLFIRAELADTSTGRDLYTLIKRGDVDAMSFAFSVEEDSYNRETHTRSISKIKKLYDVAAVDFPAYDTTSISARSFFELESEKEQMLEDINRRKQQDIDALKLKIKITGGMKNESN